MKRIIVNFILITVFCLLFGIILLSFAAEMQFEQAKKLEKNYRWKKAEEKYQLARRLNPIKAEYFAAGADFMMRQSICRQDEGFRLSRAEKLYKDAARLNPGDAEHWYLLGMTQLRKYAVRSARPAGAMDSFRKAIDLDPYDFRINYFIGHNLLTVWKSLDREEKYFAENRLKYTLRVRPWYANFVYPAIMNYTRDFNLAKKVTPDNSEARRILSDFIETYEE